MLWKNRNSGEVKKELEESELEESLSFQGDPMKQCASPILGLSIPQGA